MQKHSFTIGTNYQNASIFLLAFRKMGKTQQCRNYTVQLSEGTKYHIFTRHKVVQYCNDVARDLSFLLI